MKSFKKIYLVFLAIFLINNFTQIKTYPHLALKNLFNVLKIDDIGFGHVLLHSKWIENMYQYGPGKPPSKESKWEPVFQDDSVAYLVRKLWFRFSEEHSLEPTQAAVQSFLTPEIFGKLINQIYLGKRDYRELIEVWSNLYIEDIRKNQIELEELEQTGGHKDLTKKMKGLAKELKGITGQYGNAVKTYESQQGSLEEEEQEDELDNRALRKIRKKLAKTKKRMKNLEEQEISKKQSLLEVANKLKLIKDLQYKLRRTGRDLFPDQKVKELDTESDQVIEAVESKIQEMLKWIDAAVNYSATGKVYEPRTVAAILWAFFFHKVDKLQSQDEKIQVIKTCIAQIDDVFKNPDVTFEGFYTSQKFGLFEERLKKLDTSEDQITVILDKYDLALHFLISKLAGSLPPKIGEGDFGYEYEVGKISGTRHNCYETAMHDLFSILWYNPKTKKYDDALFAENVQKGPGFQRFREALKYFSLADDKEIKAGRYTSKYEGKNFTSLNTLKSLPEITEDDINALDLADIPVSLIDRSVMKQEFMNIVAGRPDITYNSRVDGKKIFELVPSVKNFVNLCNYFYGTKARNLEDLGKAISEAREIQFKKENDQDAPNKINISVRGENTNFDMTIDIQTGHAEISVPARERVTLGIIKKGVAKLLARDLKDQKHITIFTLLTSPELLKDQEIPWNLPMLNLVYYSLNMKANRVKLAIIEDVLERRPQYYNILREMIHNLIEKLPVDDDEYTRVELSKILIRSGFYKKETSFEELVKSSLSTPIRNEELRLKLAKAILETGAYKKEPYFEEFIKSLMKDKDLRLKLTEIILEAGVYNKEPYFEDYIQSFMRSSKSEDSKFALSKIILEAGVYDKEPSFEEFVQLATVKNDKFYDRCTYIYDARGVALILSLAMEKGYKDLISDVVESPHFKGVYSNRLTSLLEKAFKTGHDEVVQGLIKTLEYHQLVKVLKLALENELDAVVFTITKNPVFKAKNFVEPGGGSGWTGKILALALKNKKYNPIVQEILSKESKFNDWGSAVSFALENGWDKLALDIMEQPGFDIDSFRVGRSLALAFKNGNQDVIAKISQYPGFKQWADAVDFAIDQNWEDTANLIVNHKDFDASGSSEYYSYSANAFYNADKKGWREVALGLVKGENFNFVDRSGAVSSSIPRILKRGWDDVILAVVKHPKFDATDEIASKILEKAESFAKEKPERAPKLREIIETIKQRQGEK